MSIATLTAHRPMPDTDRYRLAELRKQLDDVHADLALAKRLPNPGGWLDELRAEERDIWEHVAELATNP